MWLDRFSGNSTPSGFPTPPHNRSYSPAPRRPTGPGHGGSSRPSFGPRTSSLGLNARAKLSTNSLNSSKLPNGSALRRQISPPTESADALEILGKLIGKSLEGESNGDTQDGLVRGDSLSGRPSDLQEEIDFGGESLEDFAQASPYEAQYSERGSRIHIQTVEEYESEKDKFEDLHRSVLACDDILKSVESSLTSFQKDLGAVSAEIETLQSRSTSLNKRLENRRVVEKLLGPAVEEISVSPTIVQIISEGPVDQSWMIALEELDKRSKIIDVKSTGPDKVLAITDIKPLLIDLTNKAIERIRDFLVSQIKALRSPNINAQIIQQQNFLRYKGLYAFLYRHHPQLADEIAQAYINTMRWYYLSHFSRYRDALLKIPLFIDDKSSALGVDPSTISRGSQPTHDPLSLGRRINILRRANPSALTSYQASEIKSSSYFETPFYNLNLALLSNAIAEYTFLNTFFSPSLPYHRISASFSSIFTPTFSLGTAYTKQLTDATYDCIGLLLCVRLNQHFAFELQRQKAPVAEGYTNATNMLLWPRFQLAMDNHIDSLRRAATSVNSSRTLSLTSSGASQQSTAPHALTQRFALFLSSVLQLSPDSAAEESEPVGNSLGRLMTEMEAFIVKASKGLQGAKRERFVESNWSLVLTIIGEVEGRLARRIRERVEEARDAVRV